MLPERLVITIGAMKCGTSSLHEYLGAHPRIAMSRRKELDYFLERAGRRRDPSWYMRQLAAHGKPAALVHGESSPNYAKAHIFPGVPERIRAEAPEARLVYLVRDPTRRALSHYAHNLAKGRERRPVDEALRPEPRNNYIETSLYGWQLQAYLRCFPAERILVLQLEELSRAPREAMRKVHSFLGVDADEADASFDTVHHASGAKRMPTDLGRRLRRLPGGRSLVAAAPGLFTKPLPPIAASDATIERLRERFAADCAWLRAHTGLALAGWSV
jgi:hypothetical protein